MTHPTSGLIQKGWSWEHDAVTPLMAKPVCMLSMQVAGCGIDNEVQHPPDVISGRLFARSG